MPAGKTPFNSFPQWASVVGGVMQSCELGDPCLPHVDKDLVGGDRRASAMSALYSLVYDLNPDKWIPKQELYKIISANQEQDERLDWFGDLAGSEKRKSATKAGMALSAFKDRIIAGVALRIDTSDAKSTRHQVLFENVQKAGHPGNPVHLCNE